ncbi:MAG TPA: cytochrome c oxidase subunit II [Gammaproteobacteria bacterium]|nr:cytochrome c oxidase subunit II [Gammaproteobacteria bacterium]
MVNLLALLLLWPGLGFADWTYNLTEGVTPISHKIYDLHMLIFYICLVVGIAVYAVLFYSTVMHRKSRGVKASQFSENLTVEIVWTVIPFLILIGMVYPSAKVLMDMENDAKADVSIKVTGVQWKWKYDYLDDGFGFYSSLSTPSQQIQGYQKKGQHYLLEVDNPLVVPIHKKIRFLITSQDVIHSWWVPDLGVKQDAIPGYVIASWARIEKPGIYRGQCTELCGMMHGYMPVVVKAVTEKEYEEWIRVQKGGKVASSSHKKTGTSIKKSKGFSVQESIKQGGKLYSKVCAACHQANGAGMDAIGAKSLLGAASKATMDPATPIEVLLEGQGNMMQSYAHWSNEEIADVLNFIRNKWGNEKLKLKVITPKMVSEARSQ